MANIFFSTLDLTSTPSAKRISLTPAGIVVSGSVTEAQDTIWQNLDSNGQTTFNDVFPNYYTATIYGKERNTLLSLIVPTGSLTYNARDLALPVIPSGSFLLSGSYYSIAVRQSDLAFNADNATSASYATFAQTIPTVLTSGSLYQISSSWSVSSSWSPPTDLSGKQDILITGSTLPLTASRSISASFAPPTDISGKQNIIITGSTLPMTASQALSASWSPVVSSSYASFAQTVGAVLTTASLYQITSSYSNTASFALNVGGQGSNLITGSLVPITASQSVSSSYAPDHLWQVTTAGGNQVLENIDQSDNAVHLDFNNTNVLLSTWGGPYDLSNWTSTFGIGNFPARHYTASSAILMGNSFGSVFNNVVSSIILFLDGLNGTKNITDSVMIGTTAGTLDFAEDINKSILIGYDAGCGTNAIVIGPDSDAEDYAMSIGQGLTRGLGNGPKHSIVIGGQQYNVLFFQLSGSNLFKLEATGSTGTLNLSGSISASFGFFGTASNAISASWAPSAVGGSSSNLVTGSLVPITSSYSLTASVYLGSVSSASFATNTYTASYIQGANVSGKVTSATTADTASFVSAANVSGKVSSATTSDTASYITAGNVSGKVSTATTADTASYIVASNVVGTVANATSASYAVSASFAPSTGGGSSLVTGSLVPITSSQAITASALYLSSISSNLANAVTVSIQARGGNLQDCIRIDNNNGAFSEMFAGNVIGFYAQNSQGTATTIQPVSSYFGAGVTPGQQTVLSIGNSTQDFINMLRVWGNISASAYTGSVDARSVDSADYLHEHWDFVQAHTASGQIDGNWGFNTGSVVLGKPEVNHPGIVWWSGSNVINQVNTFAPVVPPGVPSASLVLNDFGGYTFIVNNATGSYTQAIRLGLFSDITTETPAHAIYFEKSGSAGSVSNTVTNNWGCVIRSASIQTSISASAVAATASNVWHRFNVQAGSGTSSFFIDNVAIGSLSSSLTGSIPMVFGIQQVPKSAVQYGLKIDYVELESGPLSR